MSTPKTPARSARSTRAAKAAAAAAPAAVVREAGDEAATPVEAAAAVEAVPAAEEAAPVAVEAVPAVEEAASVAVEAVPAAEEAAPVAVGAVAPVAAPVAVEVVAPAPAAAAAAAAAAAPAVTVGSVQVEASAKAGCPAFKGYEDVVRYGKENVEALVLSGNVLARGAQDLSKIFSELAQEQFQGSVAGTKSLLGAKTVREWVDLSSQLFKSNVERLVSEGTRISSLSTKIAQDAFAPINGRLQATVSSVKGFTPQAPRR